MSAPIRFAALVRVSTERQESAGESLPVQRSQVSGNVSLLGGTIAEWYGGAEHATPGYERKEMDRLLADAARGKFDAVIVAKADRWSRDNAKAAEGFEVFKAHGIKFYIGVSHYDLFSPDAVLQLELFGAVGKFQAANQAKASILSRIKRARDRGVPTAGKFPFGRTYDKDKGEWVVDPDKQAQIVDIAARLLKGESAKKLAAEYGMGHANLCRVLRDRCGSTWIVSYNDERVNIAETVTMDVPPLLDEATIKKVCQRLDANRTYLHRPPVSKHDYLLTGRIFCGACGCSLTGQQTKHRNGSIHPYYRHRKHNARSAGCVVRPRPSVNAAKIEAAVVRDLFTMFGNPSAIERAVKDAIPDCEKSLKAKARLEAEVEKIAKARGRILGLVVKEAITDAQAEPELKDLKDREALLREELEKLRLLLADVPPGGIEETVKLYTQRLTDSVQPYGSIIVYDDNGQFYDGGNDIDTWVNMGRKNHRSLIDSVFGDVLPDGSPGGVYIIPSPEKVDGERRAYSYELRGRVAWRVARHPLRTPETPHYMPRFRLTGTLGTIRAEGATRAV